MKASLKNYRQAPRKVALVARMIRGKKVSVAKQQLAFLPKRAAPAIAKLLESVVANARAAGASPEELFIKTITVNKGKMQKRPRPFARGRSGVIRNWKSRWFSKTPAEYRRNVMIDAAIRRFLKKRLRGMFVTSVEIERAQNAIRVLVKTSRPGLIIGRGGEGQQRLAKEIE